VRHQGQAMTFDWSGSSRDIKWAAFYSDCEHEVLEITSGHRITLTYNLYMRRGLGEMAGHSETLDPHQLPMYKEVKNTLARSEFMADGKNKSPAYGYHTYTCAGGILGKYCSHAYAHATDGAASALPSILKGSDMVAFEVFRSLGIEPLVRPVIDHIRKHEDAIGYEDKESELHTHDYIGKELTEPLDIGFKCEAIQEAYHAYPSTLEKVTWVNEPKKGTENMQFAYLAVRLMPDHSIVGTQAKHRSEFSTATRLRLPLSTVSVRFSSRFLLTRSASR
jgi:hypothetical protein